MRNVMLAVTAMYLFFVLYACMGGPMLPCVGGCGY
jgi:hypothetical protein